PRLASLLRAQRGSTPSMRATRITKRRAPFAASLRMHRRKLSAANFRGCMDEYSQPMPAPRGRRPCPPCWQIKFELFAFDPGADWTFQRTSGYWQLGADKTGVPTLGRQDRLVDLIFAECHLVPFQGPAANSRRPSSRPSSGPARDRIPAE